MKINAEMAQFALHERISFVIDAAMSLGIERAWAMVTEKGGMSYHVPSSERFPFNSERIDKILQRKHMCPAYLAQVCLDALVISGYEPENENKMRLVASMYLTRSSIKNVHDAIGIIPFHWNIQKQELIKEFMLEGVEDVFQEKN